ncbi:MAG: poly-beta-1,6-N-acetyl-D-glucosamine biosynthesis protein PgaD [Burkholderiaceae bacterium]|nr:poly-beta-1,6-N-acetyl-D-glucosamine biosynthesis protein PgaD [Burkholderiaceae bacterium]
MIIKTQRSLIGLTMDGALTAVGWIGFFYLFTQGVMSLLMPAYQKTGYAAQLAALMPSIQTLMVYLLVLLLNGVLLVLWACYCQTLFKRLISRQIHLESTAPAVAAHFHLLPKQLHDVRDSRVTVIYHTDEGDINHLEIDQLEVYTPRHNGIYLVEKSA